MPNPWDQLPDEPDPSYARFRAYLNLGTTRSVRRAFEEHTGRQTVQKTSTHKPDKRPCKKGQWEDDAWRYKWRERASKWDIANLETASRECAASFVENIKEAFAMNLRSALKAITKDPAVVVANLKELAAFVRLPEPPPVTATTAEPGGPDPGVAAAPINPDHTICAACDQPCDPGSPGDDGQVPPVPE